MIRNCSGKSKVVALFSDSLFVIHSEMANLLESFLKIGQAAGLTGSDLISFAKDSVSFEREERLRERNLKIEADNLAEQRRLTELKIQKEEAELAEQRRLADLKIRQEEEVLRQKEREQDELRRQKERDHELVLLREKQSYEERLKLAEGNMRLELEKTRLQSEQIKTSDSRSEVENSTSSSNLSSGWNGKRFDLGIGKYDNDESGLDAFISRFEVIARAYELPEKLWPVEFSKTLQGTALEVYEHLDDEARLDYDCLIQALRRRFGITEGSYRRKFHTTRPYKGERQADFVLRLKHYLKAWLEKSKLPQTYEGLFELVVSQAYYKSQEKPVQTFLREHGKLSLDEMVTKTQNYLDAHPQYEGASQSGKRKEFKEKGKFDKRLEAKKSNFNPDEKEMKSRNGADSGHTDLKSSDHSKHQIKCYKCNQIGHKSFQCTKGTDSRNGSWNRSETHPKTAVCLVDRPRTCDFEQNQDDLFPTIACTSEVDTEVFLNDLKFPYRGRARVGIHSVNYMRDTGCSISVLRDIFVKPDEYTGKKVPVLLADRCVRYLPEAVVTISSPCYSGQTKVLTMETPVCDLIIGNNIFEEEREKNIPDSEPDSQECKTTIHKTIIFENSSKMDPKVRIDQSCEIKTAVLKAGQDEMVAEPIQTSSELKTVDSDLNGKEITSVVQTRAQVKAEAKKLKPLKHNVVDALELDRTQFSKLQQEDQSLQKYWKLAESGDKQTNDKINFLVRDGILYRSYTMADGDKIEQLMVPECLRERVVLYAHETTLSGHMGIGSTYRKLCTSFYFPGAFELCKRVVTSCLLCQQGGNRNVGGKAPIYSLPIISEPFHTVYIDIVGKINPPSAENHSYILTIMDSATHFVLAVPMKRIDSIEVAEQLMKQFDLVGYPKYIFNDNGGNLSSEIMVEIYKTFGITMKTIPVYWPRTNLVERQHGIIKSILRKLVVDQPRQWHRFLDPLMFAIRTTPNASGYSPFELLFGRAGRSHLTFLKELWSGQNSEPETKTTYQYVLDLQNKIANTCDFAQKELAKVRNRNQRFFNKNAKLRKFKVNDKVWVLNTRNENKLDFNWIGPATILEKRGHVVYKIKFENGTERMYHINMLKPYITRDTRPEVHDVDKSKPSENDAEEIDSEEQNVDELGISAAMMGLIEVSDEEDVLDEEESQSIRLEEDISQLPIASMNQTETWKDIQVNPNLDENDKIKICRLLEEYQDIFSDVPTVTNLVTYNIKLKSDEPIRHKPYRVPIHLTEAVEKELDKMLQMGWIERTDSPYASPLVIVKKKESNDLRLCVSYKDLNRITVIDPTPQSDMEDILARLGKSKLYSVFDACKGFYAIKIDEESKQYTGFVYRNAHYHFCVCPFGLVNAPSVYSKMMQKLLYKAKNVENFVDDIIAFDMDINSHLATLRDLFERVRQANIKLKPSKVKIGFEEVQYLGQIVGAGKVRPTDENVEKIVNAPVPRTKKGVRSLCGMINWLRKFIPNAAKLLKPLTDLTVKSKSEIIQWEPEHQKAWDEVKLILTTKPILTLFDPSKEHVLMTDASCEFIGGCLFQREDDGLLHPVMYASRKCVSREARYDIQNKEMLAIVWCCSRFYRFIYGAPFTIQTDCSALSILNGRLSNNARVVRWQLYLQSFNFRVEVIRGRDNCVADFLTRMGT